MKKFIGGLVIGLALSASTSIAEFGWTDTHKLDRIATACEALVKELQGLRAELKSGSYRVGKP